MQKFMKKKYFNIYFFFGMLIVLVASTQWIVLIERGSAAIWSWYKFHDYGGGGQITVGKGTQALFYVFSSLGALIGYLISHMACQEDTAASLQKKLFRYSAISLVIGMIFWTAMLLSPLVSFR